MKKVTITFALLCMGLTFKAQTISFPEDQINYGVIKKGSEGKRIFKFTNQGDKPLIINNVKVSCGCTDPNWPKTPILPGKSGEISIKYDTKITGSFSKSIEVFSNDIKASRKLLRIKGEVK